MRPVTSIIYHLELHCFSQTTNNRVVGRVYWECQNTIRDFVEATKMLKCKGYEFTQISVGDHNDAFNRSANELKLRNFVPSYDFGYPIL